MIKILSINLIPLDYFDQYKKYTHALNVPSSYWVRTDRESDLYLDSKPLSERIEDPQMLMSYPDGELCEDGVSEMASIIPIIEVSVIDDPEMEEHLKKIGNKITYSEITWTVCDKNTLIADSSIGQSVYNLRDMGIAYYGSIIESYLENWLCLHSSEPFEILR